MHHADGGKPWLVAPALSSATHQERAGFGAMQRRTVVFAEQGIRTKATRQSQSLRCERIAVGLARWVRIAPTPVERLPSFYPVQLGTGLIREVALQRPALGHRCLLAHVDDE